MPCLAAGPRSRRPLGRATEEEVKQVDTQTLVCVLGGDVWGNTGTNVGVRPSKTAICGVSFE